MKVPADRLLWISAIIVLCSPARAQDIRLYSEFQRIDPFGQPVQQDRDPLPREILSPAVPRNGHLTVHAVVTAPSGTNYFVYISSNPPGLLDIHLYREHYVLCGAQYCPEWLTEQQPPAFGAMPESRALMPGQNTRSYLLDIYVPPDVLPRRIRVEALLKTGTWLVAPMELRVVSPTVPDMSTVRAGELTAPVASPSSETALLQLLRFNVGLPPLLPRGLLNVRDMVQRNAAEDFALARSMHFHPVEMNLFSWFPLSGQGAEWYLRVRDFIYRNGVNAH